MELLNPTKMVAGYTMGMKPDGRESLVVVVKGTFELPTHPGVEPILATEQVPLVEADEFTGDPGTSATVYECDYAAFKPRCDVLLNGSAYAPQGKPIYRVEVSLKVGTLQKSFAVVGNRTWRKGVLGMSIGNPEPFTVMPISYDAAFGGFDDSDEDEKNHRAYTANPVGVGFHVNLSAQVVDGKPLSNTEETRRPINNSSGNYQPMSFGAIGRSWIPRLGHAGTYDEKWFEETFPFLPKDFDERYFQFAPEDQQVDHLSGGEEVELINLTPAGRCHFQLPKVSVPVEFMVRGSDSKTKQALLDTVIFEPDANRFILCWRTSITLKKNLFEVPMCIVGRMPSGWYRARDTGKTYYRNIHELVLDQV